MTNIEAAKQARQIIEMFDAPFVPAVLARTLRAVSPKVAAMIEAVAAQDCVSLKDGTGRVVFVA
jgi:hypothetical protein